MSRKNDEPVKLYSRFLTLSQCNRSSRSASMQRSMLLLALLVTLWATETMANNIGFDNLGGNNLDSFTSYVEDGYTVSATSGSWYVAKVFGNEIPAIFAGPIGSPGLSQISVTYEGGGQFTFGGVDLTSNSASGTSYLIKGFLGASEVFSVGATINSINHFESRLFSSLGNVDRLTITGDPARGTTSFNIDNIRAGAPLPPWSNAPEPASIMLLGAGLAGIGIWRRKSILGG